MILRALYDLAMREKLVNDPDFRMVNVSYIVTVGEDGTIRGIADVRRPVEGAKGKSRTVPKPISAPYQVPRSGTKAPPYFLVDNAKYVFGLASANKPFAETEGREKSRWFRERVADCVRDTGDAGARAVLEALDKVACGDRRIDLPEECRSNDQFAFVYEPDVDLFVHDRDAVRVWWCTERAKAEPASAGARFSCIVTGVPIVEPSLFPKVKHVPGGQSSGVSLVSFNAPAFESYGLRSSENAPVSREAAEAATIALQRLVHPAFPDPRPGKAAAPLARRHVRIGDETLVCFWATNPTADDFLDALGTLLETADTSLVSETYRSVWRGRPAPVPDGAAFYSLTLSGAQGRLVVRKWYEDTITRVSANVARYFADLAIVRNLPVGGDHPRAEGLPLRVLLGALAPLGKAKDVPAALAGELLHAALAGTPYPIGVLQRAVERARVEAPRREWGDLERRDARAALIKAVLTRTRTHKLTPDMDPTNTNHGYLCGRLMAVIERLQTLALDDVNASVVDRYFGAASATPRSVFVRLLRTAQHHARKAQDDSAKAGTAHWLKRQIDEIASRFDPEQNGFPAFLSLEDQGLFILGYHQQRHALWTPRVSTPAAEMPSASSRPPVDAAGAASA